MRRLVSTPYNPTPQLEPVGAEVSSLPCHDTLMRSVRLNSEAGAGGGGQVKLVFDVSSMQPRALTMPPIRLPVPGAIVIVEWNRKGAATGFDEIEAMKKAIIQRQKRRGDAA